MTNKYDRDRVFSTLFSILPSISRSFSYITLKIKSQELKEIIAVSYILFRIADTIEDSVCNNSTKSRLFGLLAGLTSGEGEFTIENLDEFLKQADYLKKITVDEKNLLMNSETALRGLYSLKKPVQQIIFRWLKEMMSGMEKYLSREIKDFEDMEDYCWYVAGTVGFLLSEVFSLYNLLNADLDFLEDKIRHFALSLQKVNILRDIYDDWSKQRLFWPASLFDNSKRTLSDISPQDKKKLINIMIENTVYSIKNGYEYALYLDKKELSIRFFCIFSMLLALKTLIMIKRKPLVFDRNIKVTKKGFYFTLINAKIAAHSNYFYRKLVKRYLSKLDFEK